jgi:hypothetical protein
VAYLYKGPITPVENTTQEFDPADEGNFSVAGEYDFRAINHKCMALADLGFTIYGSDQPEGGKPIAIGNKFNWALSGRMELAEAMPVSLRLANYIKGANTHSYYGETNKKSSDILFSLSSGLPFAKGYRPYAGLTLASYSGGGTQGYGDAVMVTVNGGASYRLSENLSLSGEIGIDGGSLENNGVFGLSFNGSIKYQF